MSGYAVYLHYAMGACRKKMGGRKQDNDEQGRKKKLKDSDGINLAEK